MKSYAPEEVESYRKALLQRLKEKIGKGSLDNWASYADVSKAFPGGPHAHSFEVLAIDKETLKKWASENGLDVSFIRENADAKDLEMGMPPVRFRKLPVKQ